MFIFLKSFLCCVTRNEKQYFQSYLWTDNDIAWGRQAHRSALQYIYHELLKKNLKRNYLH